MARARQTNILFLGAVLAAGACEHAVEAEIATSDFDDVVEAQETDIFVIPRDDHPGAGEVSALGTQQLRRTVFLNRGGGTYFAGSDNASQNRSGIIGGTVSVSAYEAGDAAWGALVWCVRQKMSRWDVVLTDADPGAAPHIELVLGGRPAQIGMGSIWGVAPLYGDCSTVERGVGYVFTADIPEGRHECETTVHELGHVLGLDHEYLCEDPMTYLQGCGDKEFQDSAQSCGTYSPTSCKCGRTQNTVAHLTQRLGPAVIAPPEPPPDDTPTPSDAVAPTVTVVSPAPDASVTGERAIEVRARASDDVGVTRLVLRWTRGSELLTMDCDAPPSVATCARAGEEATWTIRVGTGARSFHVEAQDAAGNVGASAEQGLTLVPEAPLPGPAGALVEPAPGAELVRGQQFTIAVETGADGARVVDVDLWWITPSGSTTHYDLLDQGGGRFARTLPLSSAAAAGSRTLRARLTDDGGRATVLADVVIRVAP